MYINFIHSRTYAHTILHIKLFNVYTSLKRKWYEIIRNRCIEEYQCIELVLLVMMYFWYQIQTVNVYKTGVHWKPFDLEEETIFCNNKKPIIMMQLLQPLIGGSRGALGGPGSPFREKNLVDYIGNHWSMTGADNPLVSRPPLKKFLDLPKLHCYNYGNQRNDDTLLISVITQFIYDTILRSHKCQRLRFRTKLSLRG